MNTQKLKNLLKNPNTNWKYIIIVAILAFIAGAIIMNYLSKQEFQFPEITFPKRIDETANWKTYRNEEYGFELKYPNNYRMNNVEPRPHNNPPTGRYEEPTKISALESIEFQPPKGHSVYLSIFNISQLGEWVWQTGGEGGGVDYEYNSSIDLWRVKDGMSFLVYGGYEDIIQEFTENYYTLNEIISVIPKEIEEKGGTEMQIGHAKSYLPIEITTVGGFLVHRFSWGAMVEAGSNYVLINKDKNIILRLEYIVCWSETCKDVLTNEENKESYLEAEKIIKSIRFFR